MTPPNNSPSQDKFDISENQNSQGFRELVDELEAKGQLREISRPTDIRHIATLVDQSDTALRFTNVIDYDIPVISGVMNSRERLATSMGCDFSYIEALLRHGRRFRAGSSRPE